MCKKNKEGGGHNSKTWENIYVNIDLKVACYSLLSNVVF